MLKIYNYYFEKLLLTAFSEVKCRNIAEDVASNVLISIFNNAAHYKYIKKPNSWIFQALKFALSNYKKRNEKYVYAEFIDEAYSSKDQNWDMKIEFANTLAKLPIRQQEIIQLHFVYGMTISETAKELEISTSTVKRQINSLREELRIFLNY